MKTAEKFIIENTSIVTMAGNKQKVAEAMIVFASLHVKAALEAAGLKAIEIQASDNRKYVSKKAIINAYPLTNIK